MSNINTKYANIESISSGVIIFDRPVKFLRSGLVIQNMRSNAFTTIQTVISQTKITLTSLTGFTAGTTVQIQGDLFDGSSLLKYLPTWLRSDDLEDFLHIFAYEIDRQWTAATQLPSLLDPKVCPKNLLPNLARSYSSPIDADDSTEVQRNFIEVAQYGYKNKGSRLGLQAAFRSLGYDIVVKEYFFGKYINTIESVDDNIITLVESGAELPVTFGAFRPDDMVSESLDVGSRVAVNNPGNWKLIERVISPYEYQLYRGAGTGLEVGMPVVLFAYNETLRVSEDSDFEDTSTNEFPLMSSFIKVFISDRRPISLTLTPSILEKLTFYLNIYKSSHARLRGPGIEREIITVADFRTDRILAYYRFEETSYSGASGDVLDSGNKGNNATSTSLASNPSGKINRSATFNGTSSFIDTNVVYPTSEGTISVWFNSLSTDETIIGAQHEDTSDSNCFIRFNNDGDLEFGLGSALETHPISGSGYHQVILTWNKTLANAYLDGELITSFSVIGEVPGLSFYVGALNQDDTAIEFYSGDIDEVELWDKEFLPYEVSASYNSGSGRVFTASTILETSRPPLATTPLPAFGSTEFIITNERTNVNTLDTNINLDTGLFLDEREFLKASITIIFEEAEVSFSEELTMSEEYTIETT